MLWGAALACCDLISLMPKEKEMQLNSMLSTRAFTPFKQFVYMFGFTIALQGSHLVEHIAQIVQKFLLHITPAHGLIGQLDLEQVHFAFNLFYLSTLLSVMVGWLYFGSQATRHHKAFAAVLLATLLVQSYHMVEHVVKLMQFISSGMQGTPGILRAHFDGVIVHAVMNTAVFLPVVAVFLGAGIYKHFWPRSS
jgi:hypothetical protein